VNAGHIEPEAWVQDLEEGGGRIVGEVCHFIDLITYMAGGNVLNMSAIHIPADLKIIKSEDNIIVTLAFDNGSIGVLTYTSIGGKNQEKERIEVFSGGSSIVIKDFIEFNAYNSDEKGSVLKKFDKGHKQMIIEISKKLKGQNSMLVPFSQDIEMTSITLSIIEQIHSLKQTTSNI